LYSSKEISSPTEQHIRGQVLKRIESKVKTNKQKQTNKQRKQKQINKQPTNQKKNFASTIKKAQAPTKG